MTSDSSKPQYHLTQKQYAAGLEFMLDNFPCSSKNGKCEGCEIDFMALLDAMEITYDAR